MSNRFSLSGISQIPLPTDDDEPTKTEIAAADRAAERTGFTSKDVEAKVMSSRRRKEPSTQISVRLPISVSERFRDYCEENRYTYGQIIEIWMKEKKI